MTYEELLIENKKLKSDINKYEVAIAEKESTIAEKESTIAENNLTIAAHLITIANMKQQIDLMKKYIFGSKSETTAKVEDFANGEQCSLFCEEKLPKEVNEEIKESEERSS